jgi:hypothetical protein
VPVTTALPGADLHHPAVDAAMATAGSLLGMETVFIGGLTGDDFVFERLRGDLAGGAEGDVLPRLDSMCHRLLAGAANATADAGHDPDYANAPARLRFGITSYVGMPLLADGEQPVATLCAIDHREVPISPHLLDVMRELAHVVEAHLSRLPVIRRSDAGWRGSADEPDLLSAMVLADLLDPPDPPRRAPAAAGDESEPEQLRSTVRQLEHALSARVVVEQAIGVLAERQRVAPRTAFERLRRAARSRGRRVQDLAREIMASAADPGVPLPPDLAGRR